MDIEEFLQYCPADCQSGPKRAVLEAFVARQNREDEERRSLYRNCVNAIADNPRLRAYGMPVVDGSTQQRGVRAY